MRKIISFSLWGSNLKYTVGAIRNAELTQIIYPGWVSRFYIGSSVPNQIIYTLENIDKVEIVEKKDLGDWSSAFWRFFAYDDAEVVIFRDTDSRLNMREKAAVDEWLNSEKNFHVMRDHPYHKFDMLAGMWGAKRNNNYNLTKIINKYMLSYCTNFYGAEYNFFRDILYPIIKKDTLVHDPFFDNKPFPTLREKNQFVGQVFDENENTVIEHLESLEREIKNENK